MFKSYLIKRVLIVSFLFVQAIYGMTQSVSINEDGSGPHNSAVLDISSSTKGVRIPRVDTATINASNPPTMGVLTIQPSDSSLYFYDGTRWVQVQFNYSGTRSDSAYVYEQTCMTLGNTNVNYAYEILQTSEGGFIVSGSSYNSNSPSSDGFYVVKIGQDGVTEWRNEYGVTTSGVFERALGMVQADDGGIVLAGYTSSNSYDMYIMKIASDGSSVTWSKTIGNTGVEEAAAIAKTNDGGYVVAGYTDSYGAGNEDMLIVKLDSDGDTLWTKTFGTASDERANGIIQTSDGGYCVAGEVRTGSFYDAYVVKLNSSGSQVWTRKLGTSSSNNDYAYDVVETSDGGFVFVGSAEKSGFNKFWVVKLNSSGTVVWNKAFGESFNGEEYARSVIEDGSGNIVVCGSTTTGGAGSDTYIVKLSSDGTTIWTKTVGGIGIESAEDIIQTVDGGYVFAGYSNSLGAGSYDMYVVKLDEEGNTCCASGYLDNVSAVGTVLSTSSLTEGSGCDVSTIFTSVLSYGIAITTSCK